MKFTNPTPVRLGLTGTIADRRYRVAGRIVLGMEQDGETYYWNEFHLVAPEGGEATLVHEVTDDGVVWRFFTAFEPQQPVSAAEAAAASVGDSVKLDDRPLRVTLVDESRVYHVEGTAPEGVEVGDVARYFNAEDGNAMVVVSWTGDEVEFFRGHDLPRGAVARAFGLASEGTERSARLTATKSSGSVPAWLGGVVFAVLAVLAIFGFVSCRNGNRLKAAHAVPVIKAAAAPLPIGQEGRLDGIVWRISGHALVEVAEVGRRYEQHEYQLRDSEGARALLIFNSASGGTNALHLLAFQPEVAPSALHAATNRVGDTLNLDGLAAKVTSLSRTKIVPAEQGTNGVGWLYGLTAQAGPTVFLVRWSDAGIEFYRGKASPAAEVVREFRPGGSF
jgi:hypothetical protein